MGSNQAGSFLDRLIDTEKLTQGLNEFLTSKIAPIVGAVGSLGTALGVVGDAVNALQRTEYTFSVDLTTGQLMYDKVVTPAQQASQEESNNENDGE